MATSDAETNRVPILNQDGSFAYLLQNYGWSDFSNRDAYNYYAISPNSNGYGSILSPFYSPSAGFMRSGSAEIVFAGDNELILGAYASGNNGACSLGLSFDKVYPTSWSARSYVFSLHHDR